MWLHYNMEMSFLTSLIVDAAAVAGRATDDWVQHFADDVPAIDFQIPTATSIEDALEKYAESLRNGVDHKDQ